MGVQELLGETRFYYLNKLFLISLSFSRKLCCSMKLGGTEKLLGEVRECTPPSGYCRTLGVGGGGGGEGGITPDN